MKYSTQGNNGCEEQYAKGSDELSLCIDSYTSTLVAGVLLFALAFTGSVFYRIILQLHEWKYREESYAYYPFYKKANISAEELNPKLIPIQNMIDHINEIKEWLDVKSTRDVVLPLNEETLTTISNSLDKIKNGNIITNTISELDVIASTLQSAQKNIPVRHKPLSYLFKEMRKEKDGITSKADDVIVDLSESSAQLKKRRQWGLAFQLAL